MSRLPSRNDVSAVFAGMPVIFSAASLSYKILSSLYINGKAGHVMEEFRLGLRPQYEAAPPLQTLRSNLLVLEAQASRCQDFLLGEVSLHQLVANYLVPPPNSLLPARGTESLAAGSWRNVLCLPLLSPCPSVHGMHNSLKDLSIPAVLHGVSLEPAPETLQFPVSQSGCLKLRKEFSDNVNLGTKKVTYRIGRLES